MSARQVSGIADIAPESVLLAGAGRAILLQLAHPAVGHGVARHSNFAANPLKRLNGTLTYIYALTNGTPEQRAAAVGWVRRAHAPVRGEAGDDHPAYDARDPNLQLWVAATLYDSAMVVYDAVFPALEPAVADAVYRDYAMLGTALGMPAGLWPASRADFAAYWAGQVGALRVDGTVRAVADELMAARNAPWWLRAPMPVARFLTAGLLPDSVRDQYGMPWSPRRDRWLAALFRVTAGTWPLLPARLRHAPMRFYLDRIPVA
ncbi:oxygenase MpaB family protein [Specibacter cremeus]|uniref:oxygenase MpaB family protein n=1 Tax=Specibacter cremeus TaxID=1629051 RepID=UPI000F7B8ADE|nr:oxygenase MpaB family protein [Specibacter cremeus]